MSFLIQRRTKGVMMKKGPAISVIIPVYNVAPYLRQCLNSVLFQSFQDIEIICIDDGSTDQSPALLKTYAEKYKQIHVISQTNQGVSAARNVGLKKATGAYVYFLDSDDYIAQDALSKAFELLKTHKLDMLHVTAQLVDERGNEIPTTSPFLMPFVPKDKQNKVLNAAETYPFLFQMSVNPGLSFFKRSFLLKNKITFPKGIRFEDNPFFFQSVLCANRLMLVPEPLYFYRVTSSSVTGAKDARQYDLIKAYQHINAFLIQKKLMPVLQKPFLERQMTRLFDSWLTINTRFKNGLAERCHAYFKSLKLSAAQIEALPLKLQFFYRFCLENQPFPEVTIIIWAYHTMPFLEKCLKSLHAQSFVNFEIICCGVEKNGKGRSFILKWLPYDNRITCMSAPFDSARYKNKALARAKGSYVLFLEGFDYLDWRFLERMTAQIKLKKADLCLCQTVVKDASSARTKIIPPASDLSSRSFPKAAGPGFANALFKTSFLRQNKISFKAASTLEDPAFWHDFFQNNPVCTALSWQLVYHTIPPVRDVLTETTHYFGQNALYYKPLTGFQKIWRVISFLPRFFYRIHAQTMQHLHQNVCPILLITDTHYAVASMVTIASLKQSKKPQTHYEIFVMTSGVPRALCKAIQALQSPDVRIHIKKVHNRYRKYQTARNPITSTALLKFDIPRVFNTYDRLLYLDSDVIATQDLTDFMQLPLTDRYAAVVKDMVAHFDGNLERLHLSAYFNSGVMLLNLAKMRAEWMTDQLIQLKKADPWRYFMDQDTFNVAFRHQVRFLSPSYNYMLENRLYTSTVFADFYGLTAAETAAIKRRPILIHYSSARKPWKTVTNYHDLWMQAYALVMTQQPNLKKTAFHQALCRSLTAVSHTASEQPSAKKKRSNLKSRSHATAFSPTRNESKTGLVPRREKTGTAKAAMFQKPARSRSHANKNSTPAAKSKSALGKPH